MREECVTCKLPMVGDILQFVFFFFFFASKNVRNILF
jgi:hypothetical protein